MPFNVLVQLDKTDTALPSDVIFGHTNLTVTDSAGAVQNFALSGAETPPWSQTVAGLADGEATFSAQDVDSTGGALGDPTTAKYTPQALTFPGTSGITITPA